MACYSNACKAMCTKVVVALSVVIFILGALTAAYGAMQMGMIQKPTDFIEFEIDGSGFGMQILILGIIVIVTALLGCATAKFKKPWFATLFIILTFCLGLAMLIMGALAAFGGAIYDIIADTACLSNPGYDYYKAAVDSRMCTDQCKCPEPFKATWEAQDSALQESGQWERSGRDWNSMKWTSDGTEISTWKECYDAFLKNEFRADSFEQEFLNMGGEEFVAQLEESYDCAGVCKVPLFYMTKDISVGPPTEGCIQAAAEGMAANYGNTGKVALVTGVLLLIGMIGACPLCTGFEDDKMEKKKEEEAVE
jgi:hypothetical protein